ncbi:hypothetical protein NE237_025564 [Protea cynaroides]|uniref:Uncharacterized protein n=1 Tax=Protea cynaroides TaxID=273540 RepID=A0A9Q0H2L0_9MAGN|nr:hypothetical protein NE237_025564 [Protea cynaroides]
MTRSRFMLVDPDEVERLLVLLHGFSVCLLKKKIAFLNLEIILLAALTIGVSPLIFLSLKASPSNRRACKVRPIEPNVINSVLVLDERVFSTMAGEIPMTIRGVSHGKCPGSSVELVGNVLTEDDPRQGAVPPSPLDVVVAGTIAACFVETVADAPGATGVSRIKVAPSLRSTRV